MFSIWIFHHLIFAMPWNNYSTPTQHLNMAKSIRSKSKLRAKSIKRGAEFSVHADARRQRIATKLAVEHKSKKLKQDGVDKEDEEEMEVDEATNTDATAEGDKKVVSTSGWRDSRSQIYKQRTIKKKKNKTVKFWVIQPNKKQNKTVKFWIISKDFMKYNYRIARDRHEAS